MTPKIMISAIITVLSWTAPAQLYAGSGKLFILKETQGPTLTSSENPTQTLAQSERLELTALQSQVWVKKCGVWGCLDPIGKTVDLSSVRAANREFQAQDLEPKDKEPCRVCIPAKTISGELESYLHRIRTIEEKM